MKVTSTKKFCSPLRWKADKPAWRYVQAGEGHSAGGVMTTATGLVFFGDDAHSFEAVDAQTGKPLWHFNTGQTIVASPDELCGQFQTVCSHRGGRDVFSFSLP